MDIDVISRSSDNKEKRQCTCKFFPEARLSSFTAAEYGKISSHHDWTNRKKKNLDAGGYSPLFYAAQHGHPSSTLKLLEQGWHVDGRDATCGATPLHRAAFSGAISSMQILISWSCDLVARDMSFGDGMTPLHKAASGGRYLAVQLLLENLDKKKILHPALKIMDSTSRTPLQVARENQAYSDYGSTKRWDVVAGGAANFDKCVILLEAVEKILLPLSALSSNRKSSILCYGGDCGESCKTSQWESSFRRSLMNNFQQCIVISSSGSNNYKERETAVDQSNTNFQENQLAQIQNHNETSPQLKQNKVSNTCFGQICPICKKNTLALFRNRRGQLVCRDCKNKKICRNS